MLDLVLPRESNKHRPPVKSVVVKKAGTSRGTRLVNAKSLLAYLDKLASAA